MEMLTCELCGAMGPEVVETTAHVGGRGYQQRTVCVERIGCWLRFDALREAGENGPGARNTEAA